MVYDLTERSDSNYYSLRKKSEIQIVDNTNPSIGKLLDLCTITAGAFPG